MKNVFFPPGASIYQSYLVLNEEHDSARCLIETFSWIHIF